MCTSYLRGKYQKIGFNYSEIKRITNPMSSRFHFIRDEKEVQIKSAKEVLSPYHYDLLLKLHNKYPIEKGSCHSTAGLVAELLKDAGVQVCDGFYYNKERKETYAHTFCKLGDMYFDPTIEFAFSYLYTNCFIYSSVRVFEPQEYKVVQHAFYYAINGCGSLSYHTSTILLGFHNDSGSFYDIRLNDEGFVECLSPDSTLRCAA